MTDLIAAVIQGVVEGLTEFLPVSSTAHIILSQELLGVERKANYWKMFAVVIQLGAILAVVVYFWKRLADFVRSFFSGQTPAHSASVNAITSPASQPMSNATHDSALHGVSNTPALSPLAWYRHPLAMILISFVVTAVPCFAIDKLIGDNMEYLHVIAVALIVGGIAMFFIDKHFEPRAHTFRMEDMTLRQAIAIGLSQILAAAFPGTSRSMATIGAGQVMGLSRPAALEFSFFLSIPIMVAAASFKLLQYVLKEPEAMTSSQWTTLIAGFATSFVVAFVVIAWLMGWVRKHGFAPFALYRILAGTAILVWLFLKK